MASQTISLPQPAVVIMQSAGTLRYIGANPGPIYCPTSALLVVHRIIT